MTAFLNVEVVGAPVAPMILPAAGGRPVVTRPIARRRTGDRLTHWRTDDPKPEFPPD